MIPTDVIWLIADSLHIEDIYFKFNRQVKIYESNLLFNGKIWFFFSNGLYFFIYYSFFICFYFFTKALNMLPLLSFHDKTYNGQWNFISNYEVIGLVHTITPHWFHLPSIHWTQYHTTCFGKSMPGNSTSPFKSCCNFSSA